MWLAPGTAMWVEWMREWGLELREESDNRVVGGRPPTSISSAQGTRLGGALLQRAGDPRPQPLPCLYCCCFRFSLFTVINDHQELSCCHALSLFNRLNRVPGSTC